MKIMRGVFAALCVLVMGNAQAALFDRGGGLIYDDALKITWLQNANYAGGRMTWDEAVAWAANLNYYDTVRNVTYTDWRLPNTNPVNGINYTHISDVTGTHDMGWNISAPGTTYAGSTASELAYMYYQNLGNLGYYTPSGYYIGCGVSTSNPCLDNVGPFIEIQTDVYWSGTAVTPSNSPRAWNFYMGHGEQSFNYTFNYIKYSAWAVRPGDVAAVSEPETYALMLAGLGLLGVITRRAKRR